MIRLDILGSSGTAPQAGNPASGYLVRSEQATLWMDAGPGTYLALLDHVAPEDLDAVLISHMHSDHCTDLFALFHVLGYIRHRPAALPVLAPSGSAERLRGFLGGDIDHPFFRTLDLRVAEPGESFGFGDLEVAVQAAHHSAPALSFRIGSAVGSLGYTGDTGPSSLLEEHFRNVDLLLAEATLPDGGEEFEHHMTAGQAAAMAAAAQARRLILTHIPESLDPSASLREATAGFAGDVGLAAPGQVYIIGSITEART